MDADHTTPESLEAAIAALEQDWAATEQALAEADAALDRARALHTSTTEAVRAQRQGLETQIQEAKLRLERQRMARAKAQSVIKDTLGHATLGAILRARIEETCGDLDEATITAIVEQALAGLMGGAVAQGTGPTAVEPTGGAARTIATPTIATMPAAPMVQGATSGDGPVAAPKAPAGMDSVVPARPMEVVEDIDAAAPEPTHAGAGPMGEQPGPVGEKAAYGEAEPGPAVKRAKVGAGKSAIEAGGTKVLTFEEGDILGNRPAWPGNPFKR